MGIINEQNQSKISIISFELFHLVKGLSLINTMQSYQLKLAPYACRMLDKSIEACIFNNLFKIVGFSISNYYIKRTTSLLWCKRHNKDYYQNKNYIILLTSKNKPYFILNKSFLSFILSYHIIFGKQLERYIISPKMVSQCHIIFQKYTKMLQTYSFFYTHLELQQNIQKLCQSTFQKRINKQSILHQHAGGGAQMQQQSICSLWQHQFMIFYINLKTNPSSSPNNKGYRYPKFALCSHKVFQAIIYNKQSYQQIKSSLSRFIIIRTLRMFDLGHSNYLVQTISPKNIDNSQPQKDNQSFIGQTYPKCELWANAEEVQDQKKDGKWSLRQIMRYYQFLLEFRPLFESKQLRKTAKIFSLMAKHIRSRETSQCKSHHQKIQKYYGKIDEIIIHFSKILSPLKKEWQEFAKTQNRVLINAFPQINRVQENYQIFEFKDCIRIYIKEQSVLRYEI